MPERNMSISVNGQSQVPPGFRFHPTEEELLHYYLRKKVSYEKIDLDVIREVDLNKLEPWDIQEMCKIGTAPQNDWYLFSHKDKKYPTGTRTNRATAAGFWKATGRDKVIHSNGKRIGMRKTLVFYLGRAPHGHKSDWIMHEYRLDQNIIFNSHDVLIDCFGAEEGWVVCRIFKKKSHCKGPMMTSTDHEIKVDNKGAVEQILHCMLVDTTCKDENDSNTLDNSSYQERLPSLHRRAGHHQRIVADEGSSVTDWAALDRFVASQLDGQTEITTYCNQPDQYHVNQLLMRPISSSRSEIDLWTFTGSSSPSSYATCQTHMHNEFPV